MRLFSTARSMMRKDRGYTVYRRTSAHSYPITPSGDGSAPIDWLTLISRIVASSFIIFLMIKVVIR